jgi:hypothetical protein
MKVCKRRTFRSLGDRMLQKFGAAFALHCSKIASTTNT